MTPAEARTLARELWQSGARSLPTLRRVADRVSVPVGEGNRKTDTVGTYRPVGATCPTDCPLLGRGCYAQTGHTHLHQARTTDETEPAVTGAAIAMVRALRKGKLARLHVSGDFARDGVLDTVYADAIEAVSSTLRELSGERWTSWAYTHLPDGPWVDRLREAGVAVRMSDRTGAWGAIVGTSKADVLSRGAFACREQTSGTRCSDCKLCWTLPDRPVGFVQHSGLRLPEER